MVDLSLVAVDDMLDELARRSVAYVFACTRIESGNNPIVRSYWSENTFIECLGLCSALEQDVKDYYMYPEFEVEGDQSDE